MIRTVERTIPTTGHCDIHDLTPLVREVVKESDVGEGQVLVHVPGSTAGITTIEYEPGLVRDIEEFFERLIPGKRDYHHHKTWGDDNE